MTKEGMLEVITEFEAIENEIAQLTREYQRRKTDQKLDINTYVNFHDKLSELGIRRDNLNEQIRQICLSIGIDEKIIGQLDERVDNQSQLESLQAQIDAIDIPSTRSDDGTPSTLTQKEEEMTKIFGQPDAAYEYDKYYISAQHDLNNLIEENKKLLEKLAPKKEELAKLEEELKDIDSSEFESKRKEDAKLLKQEIKEYKEYIKKNGLYSALEDKFNENKGKIEELEKKDPRTPEDEQQLEALRKEQDGLQEKMDAYPEKFKNYDVKGKEQELKLLSSKKEYKATKRQEVEGKIEELKKDMQPDLDKIEENDGKIEAYKDRISKAEALHAQIEQDGVTRQNLIGKKEALIARQTELKELISDAIKHINPTRAFDETVQPVDHAQTNEATQPAEHTQTNEDAQPAGHTQTNGATQPAGHAQYAGTMQPAGHAQYAGTMQPAGHAQYDGTTQSTQPTPATGRNTNSAYQQGQSGVSQTRNGETVQPNNQHTQEDNGEQALPATTTKSKSGPMIAPSYLAAIQKAYKEKTTQDLQFDNFKRPHMPFLGIGFGKKERAEMTELMFPDDVEGKSNFVSGNKRELYALKKAGVTPEILQWAMMELGVISEEHIETHPEWQEAYQQFQDEQREASTQRAKVTERSSFLKEVLSQDAPVTENHDKDGENLDGENKDGENLEEEEDHEDR